MWLSLTDRLVQGPHVTSAAEEAHELSFNKTHMADLQPMATMDMNISKLGLLANRVIPCLTHRGSKIRDLAEKFSEDVREVWRRTPEPGGVLSAPTYHTVPSFPAIKSEPASWSRPFTTGNNVDIGVREGQRALLASRSTDDAPSPGGNLSISEDSGDDEDEQFSKIDMEALKQRDNTVTSIGNLGGVMFLGVRTHPRNASSPAETDLKGTN
ncbi:hypothetical protein IL306_011831 [Fusarium sp. DS 682]|nr:hypothetical protein IL306_011831 [Fusarium sp. DS 682]